MHGFRKEWLCGLMVSSNCLQLIHRTGAVASFQSALHLSFYAIRFQCICKSNLGDFCNGE